MVKRYVCAGLICFLGGFFFYQLSAFGEVTQYQLKLPPEVLPLFIPEDNPITLNKIELGKRLYFDKRLSLDSTVSCATCHNPKLGFSDGKKVAEGIKGQKGVRNSPTVLNAAFYDEQFWDGRVSTLEEQAKQPLVNPVEMGFPSHNELIKRLQTLSEYREGFQKAFGTKNFTIDHLVQAIASFERTLVTLNSPFDQFIAGKEDAISQEAKRGFELFRGKGRCITCHEFTPSYPFFTDNKYHNIGVAIHGRNFVALARKAAQESDIAKLAHEEGASELGRFLVTRQNHDIGAFKTPTLRNIELTAPYMHDGSLKSLEEVIDFYDKGGEPNPYLDGGIRPLHLTEQEKNDLIAFMKSLTSKGGINFDWIELKNLAP
jgi:cytochrome c peroxidase